MMSGFSLEKDEPEVSHDVNAGGCVYSSIHVCVFLFQIMSQLQYDMHIPIWRMFIDVLC
jgi:hypothetical protein